MMDASPESITPAPAPAPAPGNSTVPVRKRTPQPPDEVQAFAVLAARLLNDSHCEDVQVFDVRGLSPITDYIVIGTGTSDRQINAVGGEVADLGRAQGYEKFGTDSDVSSTWVVVDMVHVMVHLFEPAARGHYDLEMLWGDAPRVSWRRK